jgi:hypothetical protein
VKTGDRVRLGCEGSTVEATVLLASENGKSLMLYFEAILAGHVGMMPVLRDDDGTYRTLMTGSVVTVTPAVHCAFVYENSQVLAFDLAGEQVAAYQGRREDVLPRLMRDFPDAAIWGLDRPLRWRGGDS